MMKNIKKILSILLLTGIFIALHSCKDDDEQSNGPSTVTYPNTVTFSHITDADFRMWTNGTEVNTENLSIENYIDSSDYYEFTPERYSQVTLTFTEDSIFGQNQDSIEGYPYFISNDSIFVSTTVILFEDTLSLTPLLGIGDASAFELNRGYYSFTKTGEFLTLVKSNTQMGYFTFESAAEEDGRFAEESDIELNDTLIIFNQRALYN